MIGNRLKRARDAQGHSLRELERAINGLVSAQAIGKYERDEMMPSSSILLALAEALRVEPEYLLNERELALSGVDFRKAPHTAAREERAVEAAVLSHVERYLELEDLLPDLDDGWNCPNLPELRITGIDAAEAAATALRREWALGTDPIPSMAELLENKGVKVIVLDLPPSVSGSKAFVQRTACPPVPVIVVNARHNAERQRFTLAHELAHLVLSFPGLDLNAQEKAADLFAGSFLVTRSMLLQLVGAHRTSISIGELSELKRLFKVSIPSLAVRCLQSETLSRADFGRLWAQIKQLRLNELGTVEPNQLDAEVPQRMQRLCLRALSEDAISESKAAELLRLSRRQLDSLQMSHSA